MRCESCPFGGRCEKPFEEAFEFNELSPHLPPYRLSECPRHYLARAPLVLNDPFGWLDLLEKGLLPDGGGWLEQPAIYLETMELLRRLLAATREAERARNEQESKAARG